MVRAKKRKTSPDIGDNVLIAAGSVLGNIQIDSNVNIGAIQWYFRSKLHDCSRYSGHIVKQEGKRIGKTFDHRNLPDPL